MSYWQVKWRPSGGPPQARAFSTEGEARELEKKLVEARSFTRTESVDYFITAEEKSGTPGSGNWEVSWQAHPLRREAEAFLDEKSANEFLAQLKEHFATLCDDVPRRFFIRKLC